MVSEWSVVVGERRWSVIDAPYVTCNKTPLISSVIVLGPDTTRPADLGLRSRRGGVGVYVWEGRGGGPPGCGNGAQRYVSVTGRRWQEASALWAGRQTIVGYDPTEDR